ncbi:MAG: TIGR03790 family protein [Planctomycetota bacterium]|jgi:uncharacterized protein (TIGR03790 family)
MLNKLWLAISLCFLFCGNSFALQPQQILVIANSDVAESVQIAQYYCKKRNVPADNILALPLGGISCQSLTRAGYNEALAGPVRRKLRLPDFAGKIKCLLTVYGVPIKVAGRGPLTDQYDKLLRLKKALSQLEHADSSDEKVKKNNQAQKLKLQGKIDWILGRQSDASIDSELSMLLFGDYELYRWQPNRLKNSSLWWDYKTLMVSRLDGPGYKIARDLVDKALIAEKRGLSGWAYFDSRAIPEDGQKFSYGYFDQSLRELTELTRLQTKLPVISEDTDALFGPGSCPRTAIYCGWYSLRNYVDAFDFVNGAIGYHIASLEAADLRNPNSRQWCPAMLLDGVTATLGAVAEPYLLAFPEPKLLFQELFNGSCLVEAYYRTKPFNSWQLILIGDPLYRPFKR